jgi:hypothetical protein
VLKSWSALRSEKVITGWIESFFVEKSEKIKINEDVLSYIKIFEGKKILLTSCYQPLAEKFLVHGGYVGLFDKVIGTLMGKNNIRVLRNPFGKGKCKFIKADSYTVGIANEDADIFYLSICNEAIAVNPEVKLRKTALKKRWRVIDVRT